MDEKTRGEGIPKAAGARPWAVFLLPLGLLFLQLSRLKAFYYSRLGKPVRLPRPVVSVGNLTFGGTGKTPVTIALARMLQQMGQRPAVLLRGYGRKTKGPLAVRQESPADEVGDEALTLLRNLPGVPVAVGERREEAAALVASDATVFLLDDGFQHLRVHRDLNLLLADASRPGDLKAPPLGRLREPLSAARRADLIVATRGESRSLPARLREVWGERPVLSARFDWEERLLPEGAGTVSQWRDRRLLLFAGVGNGEAFLESARRAGFRTEYSVLFEDHARPDAAHLDALLKKLGASRAEAALTTEKDAMKWLPAWKAPVPLLYCRLATALEDPQGELKRLLSAVLEKG